LTRSFVGLELEMQAAVSTYFKPRVTLGALAFLDFARSGAGPLKNQSLLLRQSECPPFAKNNAKDGAPLLMVPSEIKKPGPPARIP
jgi:hypothetical protein